MLKSYYIQKDGKIVDGTNVDYKNILYYGISGYTIQFDAEDYSRLWGRDYNTEELVVKLAEKVAENRFSLTRCSERSDDVRYAVYWHNEESKFMSVCIQDFDIADYIEENFVRGGNGVVQFYRRDYGTDRLAEELCEIVCDTLNNSKVIGF